MRKLIKSGAVGRLGWVSKLKFIVLLQKYRFSKGDMLICNKNMSCLGCTRCVSCFDTEETIASDCNGEMRSNVKKHKGATAPY